MPSGVQGCFKKKDPNYIYQCLNLIIPENTTGFLSDIVLLGKDLTANIKYFLIWKQAYHFSNS